MSATANIEVQTNAPTFVEVPAFDSQDAPKAETVILPFPQETELEPNKVRAIEARRRRARRLSNRR